MRNGCRCAAAVLAEMQDTYDDVRRLEASIMELHRMFMDLALMVEQQGENLNCIDVQVQQAGAYIKGANKQLEVRNADNVNSRCTSHFMCI
jgi:syntaxin 1B/2/3